jgi:lambda repressor-like predicted transcriptional regulator
MHLSRVWGLIFIAFSSQYLLTKAYNVWYDIHMNKIQSQIAELERKGWSLPRIAEELYIAHVTVEKWKSGDRYPSLEKLVIDALDQLAMKKRIPKKRHYREGK